MNSNRIYLLVLFSIFVAFIPALLLRDFNALNELNYLGIAQEALDRGSWFAFYENGVPYADKPPLYLWICMAAVAIAGVHAMPLVLLASVLPFIFLISFLDRYLASDFRHQERLLIMLGMGSLLVMDVLALVGRMDMLFTMVMLLSYLKLVKRYALIKEYELIEGAKRPKYGNLSIPLLLFLAIFIKGPYGIIFPLLSILVLMAFHHEYKKFFTVVRPHYFVIVLLLVGLWALMVYIEGGSQYLSNLFFEQSAKRLGAIEGVRIVHQEPFYFFFKIFLAMTLPIGLCTLYFVIRQFYLKEKVELKTQACLSFVIVALVVLSIPKSKLEIYLLPAIPMAFYYVILSYRTMQLKDRPAQENIAELMVDPEPINTQEQEELIDEQNEAEEIRTRLLAAQVEREFKSETLAMQDESDLSVVNNCNKTEFSIASNIKDEDQINNSDDKKKLEDKPQDPEDKAELESEVQDSILEQEPEDENSLKSRLHDILQRDHEAIEQKDLVKSLSADHDDKGSSVASVDHELDKAQDDHSSVKTMNALNEPNNNKNVKLFNNSALINPKLNELSERQKGSFKGLVVANEPKEQESSDSDTIKDSLTKDTQESSLQDHDTNQAVNDSHYHNDQELLHQEQDDIKPVKYQIETYRSGHQGIEIVGQGYFLSGINIVGERAKLPKLLVLCMVVPLLLYIALFAAYFSFYDRVPALQNTIIGISFGVLSFASTIALFFLISRLFIFSLAALGVGTLSFIFILGFAVPHLNQFLGMGVYAQVATNAINEGASNKLCIYRYRNGLDIKFYDKRIELIQDESQLPKCLDEHATIVLNRKGMKEQSHIAYIMVSEGAKMIGDSLVLPAKRPENRLQYNYSNGVVDHLPLELMIKKDSTN